LHSEGAVFWDKRANALNLFRHGGFATVDEFCKLSQDGQRFNKEVDALRYHIRAILGLFNPEDKFEKSEYYLFVQSLFNRDLVSLRDDITVLTYNYDPYLEYLLYRALKRRWHVNGVRNETDEHQNLLNSVTSGFHFYQSTDWLKVDGLSVLQLHGSIGRSIDFETFFETPVDVRTATLLQLDDRTKTMCLSPDVRVPATSDHVPILFPWEIMNEKGIVEKTHFTNACDVTFHPLFEGIWERAKREVQSAKKISFVGLSMHHFLDEGLRYLFEGKTDETEIVVANPDNEGSPSTTPATHWQRFPYSPASVLTDTLNKVAPKMRRVGVLKGHGAASSGEITLVKDFSEFVRTQMRPIA
jgi:hypothetical protein